MWIMHHKALTAALVVGGVVAVHYTRAASAAQAQATSQDTGYSGPSIIGAPGPAVSMPGPTLDNSSAGAGGAAGAGTSTGSTDLATQLGDFFKNQLAQSQTDAGVANTATLGTTNVDLINNMLAKINPGKLSGTQFDFGYDTEGRITHVDAVKALNPMNLIDTAKQETGAQMIKDKALLAEQKLGFSIPNAATTMTEAARIQQSVVDYLAGAKANKQTSGAVSSVLADKGIVNQVTSQAAAKLAAAEKKMQATITKDALNVDKLTTKLGQLQAAGKPNAAAIAKQQSLLAQANAALATARSSLSNLLGGNKTTGQTVTANGTVAM